MFVASNATDIIHIFTRLLTYLLLAKLLNTIAVETLQKQGE